MKLRIFAIALFATTAAAVAFHPERDDAVATALPSAHITTPLPGVPAGGVNQASEAAVVEVVFALDTTGSMSGLIQAAKEKIWSIATTMAAAEPTPDIRIGLVAYRDRGDAYVTKVVDLSDDLDSVYAALMDFEADGGGDTPESVNKALDEAINAISWSQNKQAYQVVFLVGDAPPHMDYQDDVAYPVTLAEANRRGIFVNTIKCGNHVPTLEPWQEIASLGQGRFFEVDQAGSAVALTTPYDTRIAELSAQLDDTRMYFGSDEIKEEMEAKVAATDKLKHGSSVTSRARRAVFNATKSGRKNQLGKNELVDAVANGTVDLADLDEADLPDELRSLSLAEQKLRVEKTAGERNVLQKKIGKLAQDRQDYLRAKVSEDGGAKDSLDQKIFETVQVQAGAAGLEYDREGPEY